MMGVHEQSALLTHPHSNPDDTICCCKLYNSTIVTLTAELPAALTETEVAVDKWSFHLRQVH